MTRTKIKQLAIEIICFLFILLFVYTAVSKLMDTEKFAVRMGQSPLITNYAGFLAFIVPITELIIAVMLAVSRFRLIGLYAAFTLMALFTAYVFAVLQLDSNIPCSCGGIIEAMGWEEHLTFNSVFTVLGLIGVLLQSSLQDPSNRRLDSTNKDPSSGNIKEELTEAI